MRRTFILIGCNCRMCKIGRRRSFYKQLWKDYLRKMRRETRRRIKRGDYEHIILGFPYSD